jgi:hypothetical protein
MSLLTMLLLFAAAIFYLMIGCIVVGVLGITRNDEPVCAVCWWPLVLLVKLFGLCVRVGRWMRKRGRSA